MYWTLYSVLTIRVLFFNSKNNNIENEVPYCCWLEMLVGVPYWGKWATWICWFWTHLNDLGAWMDPTQWLCTWEEGIGIRNLCALRYTLYLDFGHRLYFFNFPLNCGSKIFLYCSTMWPNQMEDVSFYIRTAYQADFWFLLKINYKLYF